VVGKRRTVLGGNESPNGGGVSPCVFVNPGRRCPRALWMKNTGRPQTLADHGETKPLFDQTATSIWHGPYFNQPAHTVWLEQCSYLTPGTRWLSLESEPW
jgi:hypothetical protein